MIEMKKENKKFMRIICKMTRNNKIIEWITIS